MAEQGEIIIVGHTGFIGSNLLQEFLASGVNCQGVSRKQCDLLDKRAVQEYFSSIPEGSSIIFGSVINRFDSVDVNSLHQNIDMTYNFMKAVEGKNLRGVCYLSSVDVYGRNSQLPITESSLLSPIGYYGLSKYCSEVLLRSLHCPVTVLRMPGVYGPGDSGRSLIGRLVSDIRNHKTVTLYGRILRDYPHVKDICEVIRYFVKHPRHITLNVATGRSVLLNDIVSEITKHIHSDVRVNELPRDPDSTGDLVFDTSALLDIAPFNFITVEEGIAQYLSMT